MKYKNVKDGEWVQPVRHGYKVMCCDCGLVHTINFRLVSRGPGRGFKIQFQAFRNARATAAARRRKPGRQNETNDPCGKS